MTILVQKSIRPMVEDKSFCCIVEIPALEKYNRNQAKIIADLTKYCLNTVSHSKNSLTFVLPKGSGLYNETNMWLNIIENFGDFVFVEKLC
jgi:hypothetical protein